MTIRNFLKKNYALTNEIRKIDFHMNLLNVDLELLKFQIPELANKTNQELVNCIRLIYKRCDSSDPDYDSKFDEEMTRIGLRTDKFYGGYDYSKWENDTSRDDAFNKISEPDYLYDNDSYNQDNVASKKR